MPKKVRVAVEPNELDFHKGDIVYVQIDSIIPNDYNPNRQSDHEFELLCRSIEEDGFTQPVLVNKNTLKIVDGEHRWRALKALGYTEIPVVLSDMTPEQSMVATLRHNRARGNEDLQRTAEIIKELDNMGGLDWAADSLMLDDVDLNFMKSIPEAQLHLRTDNMTFEQTVSTLKEEEALEIIKDKQDIVAAASDAKKYTIQFSYIQNELKLINRIIGRDHADGILKLCNWARNNNFKAKQMNG
jgi:ParB-like chromosome segregation protein Spo0J